MKMFAVLGCALLPATAAPAASITVGSRTSIGDSNSIGGGGGIDPYSDTAIGVAIDATWENMTSGSTNVTLSKPQGAL